MSDLNLINQNLNGTKKISDVIGNEYETWSAENYIFIESSTGTGKTHFIINNLYDYAYANGSKIVILVNRNILKKQLIQDIKNLNMIKDQESNIEIFTYQEIENIDGNSRTQKKNYIKECDYIVCDECHYFLKDAMFNPKTEQSFNFIMDLVGKSVVIFMTATPKEIKNYIEKEQENLYDQKCKEWEIKETERKEDNENIKKKYCENNNNYMDDDVDIPDDDKGVDYKTFSDRLEDFKPHYSDLYISEEYPKPQLPHLISYSLITDNSDRLNIQLFRDIDDLINEISKETYKGKWLIFVSTKKLGKEISQILIKKGISKDDIEFISADFRNYGQEETQSEVDSLIQNKRFKSKILICTSVLDNGISLKDISLKNLVIMADNEVEFLQMLGRKRFQDSDDKINLFLYEKPQNVSFLRSSYYMDLYYKFKKHKIISYHDAIRLLLSEKLKLDDIRNYYYDDEMNNNYKLSKLSFEAIRLRHNFCINMEEKLAKDDNAFIKEQFSWLNIQYEESDLYKYYLGYSDKEIKDIKDKLEKIYEEKKGIISSKDNEISELINKILYLAKYKDKNFATTDKTLNVFNKACAKIPELNSYALNKLQIQVGKKNEESNKQPSYYELSINGKTKINIKKDITLESLREIVSKYDDLTDDCYAEITGSTVPEEFSGSASILKQLINMKMTKIDELQKYMLKIQNGHFQVSSRPEKS